MRLRYTIPEDEDLAQELYATDPLTHTIISEIANATDATTEDILSGRHAKTYDIDAGYVGVSQGRKSYQRQLHPNVREFVEWYDDE